MDSVIVQDKDLGPIEFPKSDSVMAPFIDQHGSWEPEEIVWLQKVVSAGSICLNVGANVGYFSKWMSRLCGNSGQVIAVEPNPNLLPFLKKNLQIEPNQNYLVIDMAAGGPGSSGDVDLFINEKNNGDNRLFDPSKILDVHDHTWYGFDAAPKTLSVRINSLDNELGEGRLDVVLIDTQGWDFEVVEGLKETLKKWRPHLLLEFTPSWLEARGFSPLKALESSLELGYTLTCPDLNVHISIEPQKLISLLAARPDLDHVNVALIPNRSILVSGRRAFNTLTRFVSRAIRVFA